MPPEESPQAKYNRLKRQLQESILSEYPNPERKGCPGDAIIKSLAERASDESVEKDANWHHLTHCSECYREFLDLRVKLKSEAGTQSQVVIWGTLAVLLLAVGLLVKSTRWGGLTPKRPENAEIASTAVRIVIPSSDRSENSHANPPIVLGKTATDLTVRLPIGSKAGMYEVRILNGNQAIFTKQATASIENGVTAFTVKIDLSSVPSGSYSMSVRQPPWDWNYVPVVIK